MQVVRQFVNVLAATTLTDRPYTPQITHTDSRPHLELELRFGAQAVSVRWSSNTVAHMPWEVGALGSSWTTTSDHPYRAWQLLWEQLGSRELEDLATRQCLEQRDNGNVLGLLDEIMRHQESKDPGLAAKQRRLLEKLGKRGFGGFGDG